MNLHLNIYKFIPSSSSAKLPNPSADGNVSVLFLAGVFSIYNINILIGFFLGLTSSSSSSSSDEDSSPSLLEISKIYILNYI